MKLYKKINLFKNDKTLKLHIGFYILNFCDRITGKHKLFTNSSKFPALVFLRLFDRNIISKLTNIYRTELINNHFRLNFNFYLRMFNQLNFARKIPNYQTTNINSSNQDKQNTYLPDNLVIWQFDYFNKYNKPFLIFNPVTVKFSQILPYPYLQKGGTRCIPFLKKIINYTPTLENTFSYGFIGKGGLRGIFLNTLQSPFVHQLQRLMSTNNFIYIGIRDYDAHTKFMSHNYMPKTIEMSYKKFMFHKEEKDNKNSFPFEKGGTGRFPIERKKFGEIDSYKTTIDNVYFHSQRKMEHEVEEIKKVIFETKEAMRQKNHYSSRDISVAIKQHLDINRISDQVYQNIERRIRLERERRGLT